MFNTSEIRIDHSGSTQLWCYTHYDYSHANGPDQHRYGTRRGLVDAADEGTAEHGVRRRRARKATAFNVRALSLNSPPVHPLMHIRIRWRTPQSARGSSESRFVGFIDGDFVEGLLNMPREQAEKVLAGQNEFQSLVSQKEKVWAVVEQLAAVH